MEIPGPEVIPHRKVQGQKGKVVRCVVDSREAGHEVESRAVRHVMNFRVAGHGWKLRVAQFGDVLVLSFCYHGQCSAGTNTSLTPTASRETDIMWETWSQLGLLPPFTSDPRVL